MSKDLIRTMDENYVSYLRDESRRGGKASSISFPLSEQQVCDVFKGIIGQNIPVTTQGARTGLTAGAVPEGGIALNLERMCAIRGLRHDAARGSFFLLVEPGLPLCELREALSSLIFDTKDWSLESLSALEQLKTAPRQFFPTDPTETSASIGGMAACNASGARSFRYGPMARHIEALRIALADGSMLSLRRGEQRAQGRQFHLETESGRVIEGCLPSYCPPLVKCAAGYAIADDMDMIDLFIGMEGTLGVITLVELKLAPVPPAMWGVMVFPPSDEAALKLVRVARNESVEEIEAPLEGRPTAIEFFNGSALDLLRRQKAENPAFAQIPNMPPELHCALYLEYQGDNEDTVAEAVMSFSEALEALGGDSEAAWVADGEQEIERMKFFRHATPEAVNLLIDERRKKEPALTKLGTDMSVPDARLEWVMELYRAGLEREGLESVIFGHAGNNHFHVNILPNNMEEYNRGKALYLNWARQIVEAGGSVSAEHGIGKIKTPFLAEMYSGESIREMRALKRIFDPEGLLNRGNLFSAE